jgi:hypothetical protein
MFVPNILDSITTDELPTKMALELVLKQSDFAVSTVMLGKS